MASRYIFVNLGKAWQAAANGKANSGITLYGFSAQIWQVRIMVECLEACTQGSTADIRGYESEMRKRILKITKYIATHKRKRDLSSERSQADWFDGCCHINDVTAEIRAKNPNKGLRPICRDYCLSKWHYKSFFRLLQPILSVSYYRDVFLRHVHEEEWSDTRFTLIHFAWLISVIWEISLRDSNVT